MRACDCGELPARRSGAMADETRRYPCLWRRDLDRCLFRLPQPFLSQYASLYAARNRAHANLLLRDIAGNELHHSMPGVALAAASGQPAFLHHVSHPPHAVSSLLPFLSAKCAARRRNSAADHRLRASDAVGGPIVKDKFFFFTAYEGTRDLVGNSETLNSPATISLATRGGSGCTFITTGDCVNSIPD